MCMICDGYTQEQRDRWLDLTIRTHGWALLGVEGDDPEDPMGSWLFTVGATESHGLPELIITDFPAQEAGELLNWAVEYLRDGGTLDGLTSYDIGWQPVHDDHLHTDLFFQYADHYRHWPEPGWMIQLLPEDPNCCAPPVLDWCTNLADPHSRPQGYE